MLPKNRTKRVKELKRILSTLSHRKLTTFTLSYDYGNRKRLAKREDDVCHADIINGRYKRVTEIISACRRVDSTKNYLNWVLRKSPMAYAYRTKQAENAYKNGVEIRTDIPANLVGFAIMAYRMSYETEYIDSIKKWNSLIKAGVNPSLAFLFIGNYYEGHNTIDLNMFGSGHCPVSLKILTCKSVYEFMNGRFSGLSDEDYYSNPDIYGRVNSTISRGRQGGFYEYLEKKLMKDQGVREVWGEKRTYNYCKPSKFAERLIEIQEDLCRKYS